MALSLTPRVSSEPTLATDVLPDGSVVKIEAVSFGIVHRIPLLIYDTCPPPNQEPVEFFKSARPTIMFTTSRHVQAGKRSLDELWTQAEVLDASGKWTPLRERTEPKPVKDGSGNDFDPFESAPPSEMYETWEFPRCPDPSPWLRVRVRIDPNGGKTNLSGVEFKIPNAEQWREQSAKQQTNGFNEQDWRNGELWRAAYEGDVDYVKELIGQGANPNSCDATGMSALAIASADGHLEVVRYLLDHGVDVNAHSKGKVTDGTALIAAASMDGNEAIVHLLVQKGADLNTRGELGWTALIWAARDGNIEYVKYLLSKGADARINALDGKSIIELTEETENPNRSEIIKILQVAQQAH